MSSSSPSTGTLPPGLSAEAILAAIEDHLVVYDAEWRYVFVNEAAARVLQKPREELLGRRIWDVFPDAVGNQYYRDLQSVREQQRPLRSEHYYPPLDLWVENSIYPTQDGVVVYSTEIAGRKRAEVELRRSETRFRALLEATAQVVWTWDPRTGQGDHARALAFWEALTGQPPDEQLGDGWITRVHPADRGRVRDAWSSGLRSGTTISVEYRVPSLSGEYRHLQSRAVPVPGPGGEVVEWIGMLEDVTDRRRTEEELRQSRELFAAFMEYSPARAWIKDADGRYVYVNPCVERELGRPVEEWVGKTDDDLFPPATAAKGKA